MKKLILVFWIEISFVLIGCSPDSAPYWKSDNAPPPSMVVGGWKVTAESAKLLQGKILGVPQEMSVAINADKSLKATNFPLEIPFGHPNLQLVSGSGHWKFDRNYAAWMLDLSIDGHATQSMDVRKWKDSLIFSWTLDNPDSGQVIVFERINP